MKNFRRSYGVLLPVFSLQEGTLDGAAPFCEFLSDIEAGIWQVLPLGPTHSDGSPYLALSSNAGNPCLIGKALLAEHVGGQFVDLNDAYQKVGVRDRASPAYKAFVSDEAHWVHDYALFVVLRRQFEGQAWYDWPDALRSRDHGALREARKLYVVEIDFEIWQQFIFFQQWTGVRDDCRTRDIELFGDLPIYVSHDSVDVWQHQVVFALKEDGTTSAVAGVPPDYFAPQGQLWGNPLYDWSCLKEKGYDWWLSRMKMQCQMYDIVRLDHFRGLESYWAVPGDALTAETGEWLAGPGEDFLSVLVPSMGETRLVAEDLGTITAEVDNLRRAHSLPGIRVLQFGFDGIDDNPHALHNIEENTVLCTGTHDNDTTMGWYAELPDWQLDILHRDVDQYGSFPDSLVEAAFASKAHTVILPMGDLLKLGSEARINTPGTTENNWRWRMPGLPDQATREFLLSVKARHER